MKNKEFFYSIENDQQIGPVSFTELEKAKVPIHAKVWFEGLENWEILENIPELIDLLRNKPDELNAKVYRASDPEIFQHPHDIEAIRGIKKLKGIDFIAEKK